MRLHAQPVSSFEEMLPYVEMLFPRNDSERTKGKQKPNKRPSSKRSTRWAVVRLLKVVEAFRNKSEHPCCGWDIPSSEAQ
jgi:hypothetical protein